MLFVMDYQDVASALEELRVATDRLFPASDRFDLEDVEIAITDRMAAVKQLNNLIERDPEGFGPDDLEKLRACHTKGKRAYERLLENRTHGWTTATELSQDQYVIRSFARLGAVSSREAEG